MRDLPPSSFFPPMALQKWGEDPVAGTVSEGGEFRMYALCAGNVAATKSAKDKGFSRFFMGAKVGRKELCQRWRSFWVSDERRDFELGDRDEGGLAA